MRKVSKTLLNARWNNDDNDGDAAALVVILFGFRLERDRRSRRDHPLFYNESSFSKITLMGFESAITSGCKG